MALATFAKWPATITALTAVTAMGTLAQSALAQPQSVQVTLTDRQGQRVGTATLTPQQEAVEVSIQVSGLSPGEHGVHIHSTGACEPPDFKSAGPHFSPDDSSHGFLDQNGPHAGDLPMLSIGEQGGVTSYAFKTSRVSLDKQSLLDPDGSSLIIHAKPDDYYTDTGGGTGDRIICGVISPAPSQRGREQAATQTPQRKTFAEVDKNSDRQINRGEAAAAGLTRLMENWQRADNDNDGSLSQSEYRAYGGPGLGLTEANPKAKPQNAKTVGKGKFQAPETALWDEKTDTYLVSNINGGLTALDDNGFISKVLPSGQIAELKWIDGGKRNITLNGPKGMVLTDQHLVVADVHTLRFFDRVTGEPVSEVPIPDSYMLNDPAVAADGTIYVTDTGTATAEHPGAIYRISNGQAQLIAKGTEYDRPDGLITHGQDLLVTPFAAHADTVYRLTMDGDREPFATVPKPKLDGLIELPDGSFIVTSWGGKEIYRLQQDGSVEIIASDIPSPAQIGFDQKRDRLLVPVLQENKMLYLDMAAR